MLSSFIVPALTAVIGLIMIFAAEPIIYVLIVAFGLFFLISGIYILFTMSKLIDDRSYKIDSYIRGGVSILLGLLCIIRPRGFAEGAWKATMITLGVFAICSALLEIYAVVKLSSAGINVKKYLIEIVSTFVAAIVLFLLPSDFGFTLIKFAGIVFIVIALITALVVYKNRDIVEKDAPVTDEE